MRYALINGIIHTGFNTLYNHALVVENDTIRAILPQISLNLISLNTIDVQGCNISAGFIDLQLNGCGGVQFSENIEQVTAKTITIMQKTNERFGCTSFLPTLITSTDNLMLQAVLAMRKFCVNNKNQALGLHFEGPWLNPIKKGTHEIDKIRKVEQQLLGFIVDNSDVIKKVTLAPELVDYTTIKTLRNSGIVVSAGHTNANYIEAKNGFRAGVNFATHLFNAMPQLNSRDPGIIGAILEDDIYSGIIVDGLHVDFTNVMLAKKLKQDKLCLVTDAVAPAGKADMETFIFAGKTIFVKQGKPVDEHGTLSGSSLTMIDGVMNLVQHVNIPILEAIRMASLYPARAIGVDNILGSLEEGKIANITVFDKSFNISTTIVNGEVVYNLLA